MGFFKKMIDRLTWRKRLCPDCKYYFYVGERGPCYICKQGSEFKKYDFEKEQLEMTKQQYQERNLKERERIMIELDAGAGDKDLLNLEYLLYSIEMGSDFYKMGCVRALRKAIEALKKEKERKEQDEVYKTMEGK